MAFNTPITKTEDIVFGRGVLYLALFGADGVTPLGERDLGETPGFTLTVASTKTDVFSSRSGIGQKILSATLSVQASGKIDLIDMSMENLALFIAGSAATFTQASGTVTAELIPNLVSGLHYQCGASSSAYSGVRNISAFAARADELKNAAARVNSAVVTLGQIFKSSTTVLMVTTAGTLAGSAPSYTTANIGDATTDGTAVVKYMGTTADASSSTDYSVSLESGRVGILTTGNLGKAADLYHTVTGNYLHLSVDYTRPAATWAQVTSNGAASVTAQLRFVADNAIGKNKDLFIAACTLEPAGDNAFITDNAPQKFSLNVDVNQKDTSTPQIIVDGRIVG